MYVFKKILNVVPRPFLIKVSYLVRPFLALYYRGNRFVDPIDGRSFRKFLPYGYNVQRENALSPSTLSLERHRLLWLFLKRETNFFSDKLKVLHVAPEQAFFSRFKKQENIEYVTTDLYSPLADVKADICNLPFEDGCFDVVFCNHVLEHIADDRKAMSELYRVMKRGGWGVFQIPLDRERKVTFSDDSITSKEERTRVFGQYDHLRVYGMDYFLRLEEAGFCVEKVECSNVVDTEEIQKYCLDGNEIIPFVKK